MKQTLFAALAVIVLAGMAGCRGPQAQGLVDSCGACTDECDGCESGEIEACGDPACVDPACIAGRGPLRRHCGSAGPAGPPTGTITYPYYTLRGPRSFFAQNPRAIGP